MTKLALLLAVALAFAAVAITGARSPAAEAATTPGGLPEQPAVCRAPAAQGLHRAGLVVTFGEGDTLSICVEFAEESISGIGLLERSGLQLVTSASGGLGDAVCRIEEVGCSDPGDCFCHCRGGTCQYWAYYQRLDEGWRVSGIGPSTRRLRDGDVDGWSWGAGGSNGRPSPPSDGLCQDDTPTPAPPPTPARPPTQVRPTSQRPPVANENGRNSVQDPSSQGPGAPAVPTWAASSTAGATSTTPTPSTTSTADRSHTATPASESSVQGNSARPGSERAERQARADDGGGEGGIRELAIFGGVVAGLLGAFGVVWYRRSRFDG